MSPAPEFGTVTRTEPSPLATRLQLWPKVPHQHGEAGINRSFGPEGITDRTLAGFSGQEQKVNFAGARFPHLPDFSSWHLRPGLPFTEEVSIEMADTRVQLEVEDRVRENWMRERFSQPFYRNRMPLTSGDVFDFDTVSDDKSIAACISTSAGKAVGGKFAIGKLMKLRSYMLFCTLQWVSYDDF